MGVNFFETLSGAVTTDVLIIFAVFAVLFFLAVREKSTIVSIIISLYVGILTFLSFPFLEQATFLKSSETQITLSHIFIFIVLVYVVHLITRRVIYVEYPYGGIMKYAQAILLSLAATALIFAFFYHTLPVGALYDFNDAIDGLFSSQYFFWWLVAPLGGLLITSRN